MFKCVFHILKFIYLSIGDLTDNSIEIRCVPSREAISMDTALRFRIFRLFLKIESCHRSPVVLSTRKSISVIWV